MLLLRQFSVWNPLHPVKGEPKGADPLRCRALPPVIQDREHVRQAQGLASYPYPPLGGGMPKWIDGIADTNCIATLDSMVVLIDRSGCLYVSHDHGATWSCPFDRLTGPSGLHIC